MANSQKDVWLGFVKQIFPPMTYDGVVRDNRVVTRPRRWSFDNRENIYL